MPRFIRCERKRNEQETVPAYDYVCQDCESPFEVRMSMSEYSEGAKPECPSCGSTNAERRFSAVNVMTGSGGGGSSASSGPSAPPCGHGGFT